MSVFADSSAVVKLYISESGCDQVRELGSLVVSQVARVEVPAAVWRKHRMCELTANDAALLVAGFEADYYGTVDEAPRFSALAVTVQVLDVAARFTGVHGLCGYDAIQLASAQAAATGDPECRVFAAFDETLRSAAAAEGFALAPA